jgi:hypothetical protein
LLNLTHCIYNNCNDLDTASVPEAGRRAIATIEKSKTFQPLLKKENLALYELRNLLSIHFCTTLHYGQFALINKA